MVAEVKPSLLRKFTTWNFRAGDYLNNHLIHIVHLRGEIKPKTFIDLPNTIEGAKTVLKFESSYETYYQPWF